MRINMRSKISVILILQILLMLVLFEGCLTFHKVSYIVKLKSPNEGTVLLTAYDIRSTAKTSSELNEDKNNLFEYMLKSSKFLQDEKAQGKEIDSRKLYIENDQLIGQGEYNFSNINSVEGMKYDGGFHYLNLQPDDSVIATNGTIIKSNGYKRIVWDSTYTELKFTMLGNPFTHKADFKSLAPYFNQSKKKDLK